MSVTREAPPPPSTAVIAISLVPPTALDVGCASITSLRSGGTAWPPELPPPGGGGGRGGEDAMTVNGDGLVAVPPSVVTEIAPVNAPTGTVAEISFADVTVNPACVPPNVTLVVPARFVPVIVTRVPTGRSPARTTRSSVAAAAESSGARSGRRARPTARTRP